MTVTEFTAVTTCPKCKHIAVHWIEEPPTPRRANQIYPKRPEYFRDIIAGLNAYGRAEFYGPKFLLDSTNCRVIRQCRNCDHHWGET